MARDATAGRDAVTGPRRGFLEAVPEALLVLDGVGRIRGLNQMAADLLDADPATVTGHRLDEFLLPGDDAAADALLARLLADPGTGLDAYIHRRGDGVALPVRLRGGRDPDEPDTLVIVLRDLRRRHALQAALSRGEERLRVSQSLAHLGSFEMTYPGPGPAHWSDEVYRILGLEPGSEIPTIDTLRERLIHPDDQSRVAEELAAALRGDAGTFNAGYRIRRADGSVRHVRTSARLRRAAGGEQWCVTGTILDTTEQVRYEQALRAERDRAAAYLNLVAVIVVAVDTRGNITLLNDQGLRILGCREDEVLGRNFFDLFIPEENRSRAKLRFQHSLRSEDGLVRDEGWIETCGRGRRLIRWRNKRLVDNRGQVIGLLGAGEDVTEQRATAEQLARAEEELRLTFMHAPIGMATLSLGGEILDVNQSFCTMMGQPEEALSGRPLATLLHPDERPEVDRVRNRLIGDEVDTLREELRFLRADGATRHGVVRYSLVRDARHRPLMLVAQIVDRSERIKAEMELQQHRDRLAHVARLGTMGEMAGSIAHELNQPLTAISNYAQACYRLLDAGTIPAGDLKEVLGKIHRQAQRAGMVIQGLRNFVKRRAVSLRPVEIDRLLSDVVMLADVDTRNHGIPLRLESDSHLPAVQADPVQIQQVLLNLIRNAVDAMKDMDERLEGIVVEARCGPEDEVLISVSDRGPGIAEEHLPRLFEPFFTTKADGMGMGLSLSRTISESHGGHLDFTPRPGGGTIFTLRLPTLPED